MTDDTRPDNTGYDSIDSVAIRDSSGGALVTLDGAKAQAVVRAAGGPERVDEFVNDLLKDELESMNMVKCHGCGYIWDYQGSRDRATCPNCRTKTGAE